MGKRVTCTGLAMSLFIRFYRTSLVYGKWARNAFPGYLPLNRKPHVLKCVNGCCKCLNMMQNCTAGSSPEMKVGSSSTTPAPNTRQCNGNILVLQCTRKHACPNQKKMWWWSCFLIRKVSSRLIGFLLEKVWMQNTTWRFNRPSESVYTKNIWNPGFRIIIYCITIMWPVITQLRFSSFSKKKHIKISQWCRFLIDFPIIDLIGSQKIAFFQFSKIRILIDRLS